jgi:hypothetical protein
VAKFARSRCPRASAIPRWNLHLAVARSDHGRLLRSGAQEFAKQCQGVALSQGERKRCRDRSRGGQSLL